MPAAGKLLLPLVLYDTSRCAADANAGGAGVFVNAPDVYFAQGSNKMMFYAYVAALFADASRV